MTTTRSTTPDIVTPEAVVLDLEVAGIASRGLAKALDVLIQGLVVLVIAVVLAFGSLGEGSWVAIAVLIVAIALVVFGYPLLFELFWRGRTPGKAALGLRVVADDGSPLTATSAFARSATQLVDFFLVPGGLLAIIAALVSPRNQRLGDMVAGTIVLRERAAAGLSHAVAFPPPRGWEAYAASLDVSRLSDGQYQVIRSFLLRVADLAPGARHTLALRLARPAAERLAHTPPAGVHPELFLVCVVAAYQRRHGFGAPAPGTGSGWQSSPAPSSSTPPAGPWAPATPPPPPPPPPATATWPRR